MVKQFVLVLDDRFSSAGTGQLVGESQMTPGLQELLKDPANHVTLVCRPWVGEAGFAFTVPNSLAVTPLPDWSRAGAFMVAIRAFGHLRAMLRVARRDVPILSVGPSMSQWLLLLLCLGRRYPDADVRFLIRSFPIDSLLLSPEARSATLRWVLPLFEWTWVLMIRRQRRVVAVSRALATRLRIHDATVAPEVSWSEFTQGTADAVRGNVLFVGRLVPEKGADIAVEAFVSNQIDPTLRLRVAGVGPLAQDLQLRAANSGRVDFLGPLSRPDVLREMRAARIVIVPSRTEAFGLVALEASLSGARVLHSGVGGLVESCGWWHAQSVVDSANPADWAIAIQAAYSGETEVNSSGRLPDPASVREENGWSTLGDALL